LGSGGGFPGVCVAFGFPAWEVTYLDATAKKMKALAQCLEGLKLAGPTIHGRAEDLGRDPKFRESWDFITTRAVADLPVLLEYALPLLKPGGYLVDWITDDQKSSVDKSQNALKWLCGKIAEMQAYQLPGFQQGRHLLVVEKVGKTPLRYPRLSGQIVKHPL
jgi:16S rRNA (guanine527-N7)-methyltransferase